MTTSSFNTLAAAKSLEDAGLQRRQAEAIAAAIGSAGRGRLATKDDFATIKWRLGGLCVLGLANFVAVLYLATQLP